MPRAYSADLRERVLAACAEGLSRAAAARRFRVGERTVRRWRRQAREEGRRSAKPPGGGRPSAVAGAEGVLRGLVGERSDATLAEYVAAYGARTGRRLSRSAMCRALKRLDLPRKKRRSGPRSRTGRTCEPNGRRSGTA